MGVDEADAAKAALGAAFTADVRKLQPLGVADDDGLHVTPARHEDPDLPTGLAAHGSQLIVQLEARERPAGDMSSIESLEGAGGARPEAARVAMNLGNGELR
jgi:uncharacterized protein (DUF1684 family)